MPVVAQDALERGLDPVLRAFEQLQVKIGAGDQRAGDVVTRVAAAGIIRMFGSGCRDRTRRGARHRSGGDGAR